ncbi:MAG: hypothetical protein V1714_04385 [Pseudomonadota bacterium]
MLVQASWACEVVRLTGITGVSQVWGEKPEWHFWISGKPGPYGLVLQQTTGQMLGGLSVHHGFFAVKCFPYPESPAFSDFSPAEQEFLKSPLFDHTHTPVFEARPQIPASLFNVGSLMISIDPAEERATFIFESLDVLRLLERYPGGVTPERFASSGDGRLLRHVAGWEIGYPLFDSLVALYAFHCRRPPAWFRMTRTPGFEHVQAADGTVEARPSDFSRVLSANLFFARDPLRDPKDWLPDLEIGEEILFEVRLDGPSMHPREVSDPYINPLWWHLAEADIGSELASICGCSDYGNPHGAGTGKCGSSSILPPADEKGKALLRHWKG